MRSGSQEIEERKKKYWYAKIGKKYLKAAPQRRVTVVNIITLQRSCRVSKQIIVFLKKYWNIQTESFTKKIPELTYLVQEGSKKGLRDIQTTYCYNKI